MLDGYFGSGRGKVEHIENDGFGASVLASMDSANHFNQSFAFMEGFFCSILANDGQIALLNDAVIDYGMMMPAGYGTDGKVQTKDSQFRFAGHALDIEPVAVSVRPQPFPDRYLRVG